MFSFFRNNNKINFALVFFIGVCLLTLTGCGTTKQPDIMYKSVLEVPDDSLLADCKITQPPTIAEYMQEADPAKPEVEKDPLKLEIFHLKVREKLLKNNLIKQIENLKACNLDKLGLRNWKVKVKALYDQPTVTKGK